MMARRAAFSSGASVMVFPAHNDRAILARGRFRRVSNIREADPGRAPQISFAQATAVSLMRVEKPHSLSYQLMMETKVPSITFV